MHRDDLPISAPCQADWETMTEQGATRFCNQCSEHVHDLSQMTRDEARRLLDRPSPPCVRYSTDDRGQIRFRPLSRRRLLAGSLAAAAVGAPAIAAAAAAPDAAQPLLDRIARRLRTWLLGPDTADDPPTADTPEPTAPEPDTPKAPPEPPPPRPLMGKPAPRPRADDR